MAKRLMCRLGLHLWQAEWNEAGQHYRRCARCGRDDDPVSRIRGMSG